MNVGEDFIDSLYALAKSNILNSEKAISDFLRISAENEELISYLEKHGQNVSLSEELSAYNKTRRYPTDPRKSLPFIYTLLYIFDSGKTSVETFIGNFNKTDDSVDAYSEFISATAEAIAQGIIDANTKEDVSAPEDTDEGIDNPENEQLDAFDEFLKIIEKLPESDIVKTMKNLTESLREALDSEDEALVKSLYYGLASMVAKTELEPSALDDIKSELASKNIEV